MIFYLTPQKIQQRSYFCSHYADVETDIPMKYSVTPGEISRKWKI
jgi:hypothetical protein